MVHFLTPGKVKEVIKIPDIAYFTVLLAMAALATEGCVLYLLHKQAISTTLGCAINTIAIFVAFTPMHDAAHSSIATTASGVRWLNTFVGLAMSNCFPVPFAAFKHVHLQHHKHTNDPEHDIDSWAGRGPWFLLPFRWFTTEAMYYVDFLPRIHERPTDEIFSALVQLVFFIYMIHYMLTNGYREMCIYGLLIPGEYTIYKYI